MKYLMSYQEKKQKKWNQEIYVKEYRDNYYIKEKEY